MKCLKSVLKTALYESLTFNRLTSKSWDSKLLNEFISGFLTDKNDIKLFINNYTDDINEYSFEIKDSEFEGLAGIPGIKSTTLNHLDCNYDKLIKILKNTVSHSIQEVSVYWYNTGNGLRTIVFDIFDGKTSYINVFGQDDVHAVFDVLQPYGLEEANLYLYTKNQ